MSTVTVLGAELTWCLPVDAHELRELLRRLHTAATLLRPMPDVELLLVRDAEMAEHNSRFMGCDGPTNILSFPADAGESASLILSVDTLLREAFLYGETDQECLLRLLAHGMGHVAGLDHSHEMDEFCNNILQSQ